MRQPACGRIPWAGPDLASPPSSYEGDLTWPEEAKPSDSRESPELLRFSGGPASQSQASQPSSRFDRTIQ